MKGLQLKGSKNLILEEVAPPIPKIGEIIVHIEITGIGGSEYLGYKNPGIRSLPNIMGHSICGRIPDGNRVAINPLLGCNDCEYCDQNLVQLCAKWKLIGVQSNGGFTQQIAVPKSTLIELPENISWEQSCFIEPFANSINAWEIGKVNPKEKVLILGAGGIGLGLIACAKRNNHTSTYVLENSKQRREASEQLGAKIDLYEENDFDVVFDTVGSHDSRKETLRLMKPNGRSVFLGFATSHQDFNFSEFIRMQYQIRGSFVFSRKQFLEAIELVAYTKKEWVRNLEFDEVESQLKDYLNNGFSVIKAALRPNGAQKSN